MQDTEGTIRSVWELHPDEEYRRDQSHWRGHGRWADDKLWKAVGEKSIHRLNLILNFIRKGPETWSSPKIFLEWGPGGGSNMFAMRRLASTYFGVDISQKNLDECSRIAREEHFDGFRPILLDGPPASIVPQVSRPVNAFISTAVFQHFPSQEYGIEALRAIHEVCRPGAVGFIQIRFNDGTDKYQPISDESQYFERHITANSYKINEFVDICLDCGFNVLFITDVNSRNNYATFNLERRS